MVFTSHQMTRLLAEKVQTCFRNTNAHLCDLQCSLGWRGRIKVYKAELKFTDSEIKVYTLEVVPTPRECIEGSPEVVFKLLQCQKRLFAVLHIF